MKFFTVQVNSNLYGTLYLTYEGQLSNDKSYSGAFREDNMDRVNQENVLNFIKSEAQYKRQFETKDIDNLSIELIIEEADMNVFTREIPYRGGKTFAMPLTIQQQINNWRKEIKELEEEKSSKESDIEDLEEEIGDIESDISALQEKITKYELEEKENE